LTGDAQFDTLKKNPPGGPNDYCRRGKDRSHRRALAHGRKKEARDSPNSADHEIHGQGIKIHPLIENCPANDKEKVYPLMEAAQHHGLTVLFHCGLGENASPKRIGEVAKDFPKLPIIMGHSGLVEGVRQVVEIAKKCENVHMDSSGVGWLPFFCESIIWAGPDRVLYGSDHPFNPMDWEIEKIVKHAQRHLKLKIEDLRLIMAGNIKRLLKIK
jgi:predicted TIM-barrel fold metal-dependent hydrolase